MYVIYLGTRCSCNGKNIKTEGKEIVVRLFSVAMVVPISEDDFFFLLSIIKQIKYGADLCAIEMN